MERTELLYSDLGGLCQPQQHISDIRERYKWNSVPYECTKCSGTMLASVYDGRPEPVTLPLNAEGWYRIYVSLSGYGAKTWDMHNVITLKLTGDRAPMHLAPSDEVAFRRHAFQEVFWRCADLTGQDLEILKHRDATPVEAGIAWVRLVPMTDEEVAAHKADMARTDTKRIYATNDMHGMLGFYGYTTPETWHPVAQEYLDSDVEWLSIENILTFDGDVTTGNPDSFAFFRECDDRIQRGIKPYFTPEMMSSVVKFGKNQGLKMCISLRMGAWGIEYPADQCYFANTFFVAHPEWRTIDRDGDPIDALSFMYPEVQEYMLDQFETMARCNPDAVEMLFHRGVPYVLFEQPFVDLFQERYGEDPRYLPLDDERVTALRCEIMTGFVRKLRARLDSIDPKIGLHARCQFSVWDAKHVAVDLEAMCKEGLITAIISYPQRLREMLPAEVFGADGKIDLEKYHDHALHGYDKMIFRRQDFNFMDPMPDSKGVLQGPKSQQERIDEFMALEKKYGVKVYIEIMPRHMTTEQYRERALELYNCGAERISLWDTYNRVPMKAEWSMLRRLGHKDELASYSDGEGEFYSSHRITKIGGKDVSRYYPAWGG